MDRSGPARTLQPHLFHGEDKDRGQPGVQPRQDQIQRMPRRLTAVGGAITVQRVLADVEIEGRQLHRRKGKDRLENRLEIKPRIALTHLRIQLRQPVQHPALQLRHVFVIHRRRALNPAAQQIPESVAQPAIAVGHPFQDLRPDPLIRRVIRLRHPEPQDVRTILFNHFLRHDGVADGFGHLQALLIEREAMRHHIPIWCPPRGAHGLQQRGMEPPAVLVGALHIDIGNAVLGPICPVTQGEGMGGAGIKPHIQDIHHLVIGLRVHDPAQEPLLGPVLIPAVRPLSFKGFDNPRVHICIAQQEVRIGRQCPLLGKAGQRHAPGALTRQHPVGTRFHHRMQAVAARFRGPVHVVDLGQRTFPDRRPVLILPITHRLINRRKPLRRVAIDHRCFGAPGMRVGVFDLATGEQAAHFHQLVDHSGVGFALAALAGQDVFAPKERQIIPEAAIVQDVIGDDLLQHAEITVEFVFLHPVRRRAVDKAGAFVSSDKIRRPEITQVVPFAIPAFGSGERVLELHTFEVRRRHIPHTGKHRLFQTRAPQHIRSQIVCQNVAVPNIGPAFLRTVRDLI